MGDIKSKNFALSPSRIRPLIEPMGSCLASDMITVEASPVRFMYREEPDNETDSGWRFHSGLEDEAYTDDSSNYGIYDVNTIANYDPSIIPYLNAPVGSAFEKPVGSDTFVQVSFGR